MKNADYTVKLPKDRQGLDSFEIELTEIDEATYMVASQLAKAGKDVEATKMVLRELHAGGDDIEEVLKNFVSVQAGMSVVLELLSPLEVDLKKK